MEFSSAKELFSHYAAVKKRLSAPEVKHPSQRMPLTQAQKALNAAAIEFQIPAKDLRGTRSQEPNFILAVQAVMLLLREQGLSFNKIGRFLDNRDHSTTWLGCKRALKRKERDSIYRQRIARIQQNMS